MWYLLISPREIPISRTQQNRGGDKGPTLKLIRLHQVAKWHFKEWTLVVILEISSVCKAGGPDFHTLVYFNSFLSFLQQHYWEKRRNGTNVSHLFVFQPKWWAWFAANRQHREKTKCALATLTSSRSPNSRWYHHVLDMIIELNWLFHKPWQRPSCHRWRETWFSLHLR